MVLGVLSVLSYFSEVLFFVTFLVVFTGFSYNLPSWLVVFLFLVAVICIPFWFPCVLVFSCLCSPVCLSPCVLERWCLYLSLLCLDF